jgi:hypothetical protein
MTFVMAVPGLDPGIGSRHPQSGAGEGVDPRRNAGYDGRGECL